MTQPNLCLIDEKVYNENLNILPPLEYFKTSEFETFLMSELTLGSWTYQYVLLNDHENVTINGHYVKAILILVDINNKDTWFSMSDLVTHIIVDTRVEDALSKEQQELLEIMRYNKFDIDKFTDGDSYYSKIVADDYMIFHTINRYYLGLQLYDEYEMETTINDLKLSPMETLILKSIDYETVGRNYALLHNLIELNVPEHLYYKYDIKIMLEI